MTTAFQSNAFQSILRAFQIDVQSGGCFDQTNAFQANAFQPCPGATGCFDQTNAFQLNAFQPCPGVFIPIFGGGSTGRTTYEEHVKEPVQTLKTVKQKLKRAEYVEPDITKLAAILQSTRIAREAILKARKLSIAIALIKKRRKYLKE